MSDQTSDLPPMWALARLDELVGNPNSDIVDGPFGSNLKASEYVETGVPIIRLQNVSPGEFIEKNTRYISKEKAELLRRHSFVPGDLVITKLGSPLGEVCIVPEHFAAGIIVADIVRVRPHALIDKHALMYVLNSHQIQQQFKEHTKGTTRPRVNLDHVRAIRVPIAPRQEQKRIVAEIEKQFTRLDAATAALKRVQTNLRRYRASVLKAACEGRLVPAEAELARKEGRDYESAENLLLGILRERRARWEANTLAKMIAAGKRPTDDRWKQKYIEPSVPDTLALPELPEGWCWASLGQLTEIQGGIQKQPSRIPKRNAYPFLRVANVLRGCLDLREIHEIELFAGELDRLRLENGDLLIVEGNGSPSEIGRMASWSGEIQNCVHQNHVIRSRPIPGVSSLYLMHFWNSPTGASQVLDVASSTSGLHTLSVGKISRLAVPLPPKAEQERIAETADKLLLILLRTEETVSKQNERLASTKQSILMQAFTGQLLPQDPTDQPASALLERIRAERNGSSTTRPMRRSPKEPAHA